MKDSSHYSSIEGFFNRMIPDKKLELAQKWNYLQKTFSREDVLVIEFEAENFEERYWRCHFKNPNTYFETRNRINKALESSFFGGKVSDQDALFNFTNKKENWLGFFMPNAEKALDNLPEVQKILSRLKLFKNHFNIDAFLKDIFEQNPKIDTNEERVINSIWEFGLAYKEYLAKVHVNKSIDKSELSSWYLPIFNLDDFSKLLSSEQITYLIFMGYEAIYSSSLSRLFESLLKESSEEVQTFFSSYREMFLLNNSSDGSLVRAAKKSFIKIVIEDKNEFFIQELILNTDGNDYLHLFPEELRRNLVSLSEESDTKAFQSLLKRLNIFKQVGKSIIGKKVNHSNLSPPNLKTYNNDLPKWRNVEKKISYLRAKSVYLSANGQNILDLIIQRNWQNHLINLANGITCPFFRWTKSSEQLIMQCNTLERKNAYEVEAAYERKLRFEIEEEERLAKHLEALQDFYDVSKAISYSRSVKAFSFLHLQERWKTGLQKALVDIKRRYNKRIRRMKEFGVIEGSEKPSILKQFYFDEILEVEKEVKPYLTFVKKAFQSALPVKKLTHFDPYRHSHTGIEFDPETVYDQNKWQRGEVMKVLKRRKVYGNVQQVNSFCLDFSGSMRHERMRNLFKIIFLIITGLEDRKIFNSIHFFNEYFIPNTEFSLRYVDRKVLYQILEQITNVVNGQIIYGGQGGTNISAGLKQCYKRVMDFSEQVFNRNKEEGIVKSIFVISDGEPTLGITDLEELSNLINRMRREGGVSIKGIYIKPENDTSDFIPQIFGEGNYVENITFQEGINNFVSIMTKTFEAQRKEFKNQKRALKVFGAKGAKKI